MQAFVLATIFLMMLIYPNFIAPLFNKYEELEEGELKTGIEKLAVQNEFPLRKLFKVDGSTRSSHSNAYFFGFGKNKRIVLYDTLLNQLENTEIYAVLCHEMGHWKYSHTFKHLGALMLRVFVFFYLFSYVIYSDAFYTNFGYSQKSVTKTNHFT
jgi:STE24 endopeptidase